jgi:hypothetical protein
VPTPLLSSPLLSSPLPALRHDWPPSLQLLLGEAAGDIWTTVLDTAGGRLRGLRVTSVTLQPDGAAVVQYAAEVGWAEGRTSREVLAATTGARIPPGAAVLEGEADGEVVRVGLWRWPLDPALPGLAWASSSAGVAGRLAELGLPGGRPRLRLRAYRPGRRAVVEVTTTAGRLFLKVVAPPAAGRLVERHTALAGAVPVPEVLAVTDDGVLVLPGLPGTPMRTLLAGDGVGLPDPAHLDALLDALPPAVADLPAGRRAPGDALARADGHARVLAAAVGPLRPRLEALTAVLTRVDPGEHEPVPVHGDFYESQLLVDGGTVVGLLDVDTAGRGARIDDWATLLAHLVLLECVLPRPGTVVRYRRDVEAALLRRWPAGQLRPRVAAVLLGLATGPYRVQQAGWPSRTDERLALAEAWAA